MPSATELKSEKREVKFLNRGRSKYNMERGRKTRKEKRKRERETEKHAFEAHVKWTRNREVVFEFLFQRKTKGLCTITSEAQ